MILYQLTSAGTAVYLARPTFDRGRSDKCVVLSQHGRCFLSGSRHAFNWQPRSLGSPPLDKTLPRLYAGGICHLPPPSVGLANDVRRVFLL